MGGWLYHIGSNYFSKEAFPYKHCMRWGGGAVAVPYRVTLFFEKKLSIKLITCGGEVVWKLCCQPSGNFAIGKVKKHCLCKVEKLCLQQSQETSPLAKSRNFAFSKVEKLCHQQSRENLQ